MEFLYSDGLNDRAAVWIALHGAGRDETDMPPLVHAFAPGDAVLAPRGPLAFENGYSYFRKCPDRACGEAEIAARADHLGAFLADMCSNRFRGRTLFLYGCSSGAIMGAALLMRAQAGFPVRSCCDRNRRSGIPIPNQRSISRCSSLRESWILAEPEPMLPSCQSN